MRTWLGRAVFRAQFLTYIWPVYELAIVLLWGGSVPLSCLCAESMLAVVVVVTGVCTAGLELVSSYYMGQVVARLDPPANRKQQVSPNDSTLSL